MQLDRIASASRFSKTSPLRRRLVTRGLVLVIALLVAGTVWWRWPTRGIVPFTTEVTAKRQLAISTLDRVLGPAGPTDETSTEPSDLSEAREAYKLDRLWIAGPFICLDGCPTWYPGDPVEATRTQTVVGQPESCGYWLGHVHPRALPLRQRPRAIDEYADTCGYVATTGGVEIELVVTPHRTGTVGFMWTARVR